MSRFDVYAQMHLLRPLIIILPIIDDKLAQKGFEDWQMAGINAGHLLIDKLTNDVAQQRRDDATMPHSSALMKLLREAQRDHKSSLWHGALKLQETAI